MNDNIFDRVITRVVRGPYRVPGLIPPPAED